MNSEQTWKPGEGDPSRHGWRTPVTAPGPRGGDLIRSIRAMRREPLNYLNDVWKRYGDVVQFPIPAPPTYLITSPPGVRHILQDNHRAYGKRTIQYDALSLVTGDGLLTADVDTWRPMRRRVQPAFHHEAISQIGEHVNFAARALESTWNSAISSRGEAIIDVDAAMMETTVQVVGSSLFGTDLTGEAREIADATVAALDVVVARARMPLPIAQWLPTPNNLRLRRHNRTLDRSVYALVTHRRYIPASEQPHDLLSMLAPTSGDCAALSPTQVRDEVVTFLVAGHETVASALSWTFSLLADSPEWTHRLRAEVDALDGLLNVEALTRLPETRAVIDETLRMYPPAWVITRRALVDDVVAGHHIPRGALVIISPWLVHRHHEEWERPASFEPQRFLAPCDAHRGAYIPFGEGPRMCIGRDFALVEATLMLAHVLSKFELHRVARATPRAIPSVTLRPDGGLLMRVRHR